MNRGCSDVRSYFVVQAFACRKLDRPDGFPSVSSGASVLGILATSVSSISGIPGLMMMLHFQMSLV